MVRRRVEVRVVGGVGENILGLFDGVCGLAWFGWKGLCRLYSDEERGV